MSVSFTYAAVDAKISIILPLMKTPAPTANVIWKTPIMINRCAIFVMTYRAAIAAVASSDASAVLSTASKRVSPRGE